MARPRHWYISTKLLHKEQFPSNPLHDSLDLYDYILAVTNSNNGGGGNNPNPPTYTFANGLNLNSTTVGLGGTLDRYTTLEGDGNSLIFTNLSTFEVETVGSAYAIIGDVNSVEADTNIIRSTNGATFSNYNAIDNSTSSLELNTEAYGVYSPPAISYPDTYVDNNFGLTSSRDYSYPGLALDQQVIASNSINNILIPYALLSRYEEDVSGHIRITNTVRGVSPDINGGAELFLGIETAAVGCHFREDGDDRRYGGLSIEKGNIRLGRVRYRGELGTSTYKIESISSTLIMDSSGTLQFENGMADANSANGNFTNSYAFPKAPYRDTELFGKTMYYSKSSPHSQDSHGAYSLPAAKEGFFADSTITMTTDVRELYIPSGSTQSEPLLIRIPNSDNDLYIYKVSAVYHHGELGVVPVTVELSPAMEYATSPTGISHTLTLPALANPVNTLIHGKATFIASTDVHDSNNSSNVFRGFKNPNSLPLYSTGDYAYVSIIINSALTTELKVYVTYELVPLSVEV